MKLILAEAFMDNDLETAGRLSAKIKSLQQTNATRKRKAEKICGGDKPSITSQGAKIKIKEEEAYTMDTDNEDEDNARPSNVTSCDINIKEEYMADTDDEDRKPCSSGIAVRTEEIDTDSAKEEEEEEDESTDTEEDEEDRALNLIPEEDVRNVYLWCDAYDTRD